MVLQFWDLHFFLSFNLFCDFTSIAVLCPMLSLLAVYILQNVCLLERRNPCSKTNESSDPNLHIYLLFYFENYSYFENKLDFLVFLLVTSCLHDFCGSRTNVIRQQNDRCWAFWCEQHYWSTLCGERKPSLGLSRLIWRDLPYLPACNKCFTVCIYLPLRIEKAQYVKRDNIECCCLMQMIPKVTVIYIMQTVFFLSVLLYLVFFYHWLEHWQIANMFASKQRQEH